MIDKDEFGPRLPNSASGKAWLSQFEEQDAKTAERLLTALTLVSHSAFERSLQSLILTKARTVDGPVALYATRELTDVGDYFLEIGAGRDPLMSLDAVSRGADLGSEARVAALIRNLAKTAPAKLLNHPSLETLRLERARAIFIIDDIIGSGKRTSEFLGAMWRSPTIKCWYSRKHIAFASLAYTATEQGLAVVTGTRPKPTVNYVRDCPTFADIPWRDEIRTSVTDLCRRYGRHTSRPGMMYGFKKTMAALVFEHGCPNNTPSILWAPQTDKNNWKAIFPDRSVLPPAASAFPPDITGQDPVKLFEDILDLEEDVPVALIGAPALGIATVTTLALVANGVRSRTALSYATGYSAKDCMALLDRCISKGYLTATLHLTAAGKKEIAASGRSESKEKKLPFRGEDSYYPQKLRGHHEASARPRGRIASA